MNKVFIIGNLTRDPEMRVTPSGVSVCAFGVAVNRRVGGQQGQQREADFYNVSAWRGLGENCYKYLKKGNKVAVVGNLTLRTYEGNDGQRHASLDVSADDVEFLTSPDARQGGAPRYDEGRASSTGYSESAGMTRIEDDDLPF